MTRSDRAENRQRIIEVATEMFLQQGYGNTSLAEIAAAARLTKPTLYDHFGSKTGLLQAVTQTQAEARQSRMAQSLGCSGDVAADLLQFAKTFGREIHSEEARRWHRLSLTELRDHPEVGKAIYESGPARVIERLKKFLRDETKAGRLCCDEPAVAAEQLLGMLSGIQTVRLMTGHEPPSSRVQSKLVRHSIEAFLRLYSTKQ